VRFKPASIVAVPLLALATACAHDGRPAATSPTTRRAPAITTTTTVHKVPKRRRINTTETYYHSVTEWCADDGKLMKTESSSERPFPHTSIQGNCPFTTFHIEF
jgi:hypothetical protein